MVKELGWKSHSDRIAFRSSSLAVPMANVCVYQFVLRPRAGQSSRECLDAVRDEIADWICDIYRTFGMDGVAIPFDGTCLSPHPTHELWSHQHDGATHRLATIEWVWPEGEDPTLSWMLTCTLACDDTAVQVALVVQIVSRPFLVRPLHYVLRDDNPLSFLPALVTRLLQLWPGEVGGWPIPTQARVLRANGLDRFVRETLRHPGRTLPLVVVNLDGPIRLLGNGLQAAQDRLLALGQVVGLANSTAVKRLAQLLPEDLPWENCPARVYWPCVPDDVPHTQPLFSDEAMNRQLETSALDQVLLVNFLTFSAGRFREGDLIRAARVAVEREQSAWRGAASKAERELQTLAAELRQTREERDRLRQEGEAVRQLLRSLQSSRPQSFDELAAELERAWDDNRRLTADIETERQQLAELREELRIHHENWSFFAASAAGEGRAAPVPSCERAFAGVAEALHAAAQDFADVLVVWEDAEMSAQASPFRTPAKVYRALQAIAEVGRAYFQARDGGPPLGPVERAFACRVPFKYTGFESQTTLHLYGEARVFHHRNESRQMQRHLTLGGGDTNNCLQIYFDFDDATRRVPIGYCGRHLPYHRQRT
jgi:hypothetical protein